MEATKDGPCNVAVFLIPGPKSEDPDEGTFLAAVAEAAHVSAGDVKDINAILPDNWKKFTSHLVNIDDVIADMTKSPLFGIRSDAKKLYDEEGISHVALIESELTEEEVGEPEGFYFGKHHVKHNSLMLMYSADRNCYRLMHCLGCGFTFTKWLEEKQPEWHDNADGKTIQGQSHTIN